MTPLPRILFITHAMGGGVEAHVADLRALLAPRAEIEVLRPAGPGAVTLQAADDQRLTWRCEPWADLVRALAYALRFNESGKSYRAAGETMAAIAAEVLAKHLERAGFVVMRRPPAKAHRAGG